MKPTVLITRPVDDGASFAAELHHRGYPTLHAPMLVLERAPSLAPFTPMPSAFVVTSRHALPAIMRPEIPRDVPLYVVGEHTAHEARKGGFTAVQSAPDAQSLGILIQTHCASQNGPLCYVRAEVVTLDMASLLRAHGVMVQERIVYAMRPVPAMPADVYTALETQRVQVVTLFSARTAAVFGQHITQAGLERACAGIGVVALSAQVMAPVKALPWKQCLVSALPTRESLLAAVDKIVGAG